MATTSRCMACAATSASIMLFSNAPLSGDSPASRLTNSSSSSPGAGPIQTQAIAASGRMVSCWMRPAVSAMTPVLGLKRPLQNSELQREITEVAKVAAHAKRSGEEMGQGVFLADQHFPDQADVADDLDRRPRIGRPFPHRDAFFIRVEREVAPLLACRANRDRPFADGFGGGDRKSTRLK